jgi:acetylornithine/succinyldiaminopimelate/putrescine aminotransferase
MAKGVYREPFESVLAVFERVAFDDLAAVDALASRSDIAAILLEPIQVESGVRAVSAEYLQSVRDYCDSHDVMLLLDEVQTGLGRTGKMWAWQHTAIEPDAFATAKGLGAGMVAVGAAVIKPEWWSRAFGAYDRAEIHASTMGGNALACTVAQSVLRTVGDEAFLARVCDVSEHLWQQCREQVSSAHCVEKISSFGLLGGIQFRQAEHPWLSWEAMGMPAFASRPTGGPIVVERLARHKVLTQVCGHDWATVRVEPPLIVDRETCDRFVAGLKHACEFLDRTQA